MGMAPENVAALFRGGNQASLLQSLHQNHQGLEHRVNHIFIQKLNCGFDILRFINHARVNFINLTVLVTTSLVRSGMFNIMKVLLH